MSASYPEHEKLAAISDQSQAIGAFLEHLEGSGVTLATWQVNEDGDDELIPQWRSIQDRLAEYFGIDQNKLETEKRAMLEFMRSEPVDRGLGG